MTTAVTDAGYAGVTSERTFELGAPGRKSMPERGGRGVSVYRSLQAGVTYRLALTDAMRAVTDKGPKGYLGE